MQTVKNCLAATALVIGVGFTASSFADGAPLPPIDGLLKTYFDKSVVAGSIGKDSSSPDGFAHDAAYNLLFNYTGKVYSVETNGRTGQLTELEKQVGTIEGQAAFPMSFAMLAMGMKTYLDTGAMPDGLVIPPVIDWTCNHCKLIAGDNTYVSIVDTPAAPAPGGVLDAASIEAMRMKGRAFTGLGPVEVGQLSAKSMSVRMAGCSAVVGVAGPDAGKVGTLCVNGTFTFDLSGIAQGNIVGTGTSNCVTVMHKPLAM